MAFRYCAGDIVKANKSGRQAEIVGTTKPLHGSGRMYKVKPLDGPYKGRLLTKDANTLENDAHFTLVGGPTFSGSVPQSRIGKMKLPDIDADDVFLKYEAKKFAEVVRTSQCDCGAHKCGYKDDELHAHARWCKLVELSKGVANA